MTRVVAVALSRSDTVARKTFFIIFIDGIFTNSVEAAFTNAFDAFAAREAIACLCRAGHAD
jgi:hypothetical protein